MAKMPDDTIQRVAQLRLIVETLSTHEPYYSTPNGMECALCAALVDEEYWEEYSQHEERCPYRMANEYMETLV